MSDGLALLLTFALLAGNGFFVAAEFALVSARRSIVEPQAERGVRGAPAALLAIERISVMMAGAQLGITICSLALGALSEPAIAHLLEPAFELAQVPAGAVHPIGFVIALGVVTVLHVVLGEVVPKNVALAGPEQASLYLAPPLVAVVTAFKPLIWALNKTTNGLLRLVGVEPRDEVNSVFDRDEVAGMVAESHREGELDRDEAELVSGAIAFVDRVAGDVLLPTDRLTLVGSEVTPNQLESLTAQTGHSRFPLIDLTGYVHVKDVLTLADRDVPVPAVLVRPLPPVAVDASLRVVLETMRARGTHLVQITDGVRTLGVVAMADVLGELVGAVDRG
ncbi:hemolysin family protein [uncultured Jatrophihabitans sp.]|uniref:hemolysin family protein n=1 Tax=uncultured Jatrophihabitans sp. TaxID=1610747 RepID=UPI0035CAE878